MHHGDTENTERRQEVRATTTGSRASAFMGGSHVTDQEEPRQRVTPPALGNRLRTARSAEARAPTHPQPLAPPRFGYRPMQKSFSLPVPTYRRPSARAGLL